MRAIHGSECAILAVGQSSGKIGAVDFSVVPRLILSPKTGSVGATVVAEGTGFGAGEQVRFD